MMHQHAMMMPQQQGFVSMYPARSGSFPVHPGMVPPHLNAVPERSFMNFHPNHINQNRTCFSMKTSQGQGFPSVNKQSRKFAADSNYPSLTSPQKKARKKKDIIPPLEKITKDPIVREPLNESEKQEIDIWKAERRRNWPTAENISRRKAESEARRLRGQLEPDDEDEKVKRRKKLQEILEKQQAMGLTKKAGTDELLQSFGRSSDTRIKGRHYRGRGRTRGNNRLGHKVARRYHKLGWEAFQAAGVTENSNGGANLEQVDVDLLQQKIGNIDGKETDSLDQDTTHVGLIHGMLEKRESQEMVRTKSSNPDNIVEKESNPLINGLDNLLGYHSSDDGYRHDSEDKGPQMKQSACLTEDGPSPTIHGSETSETRKLAKEMSFPMRSTKAGEVINGGDASCQRKNFRKNKSCDQSRNNKQQKGRQASSQVVRPTKPTLLEKLLAKEMRQDRSRLLQAFRFFVLNDFLIPFSSGRQTLKFPTYSIKDTSTTVSNNQNCQQSIRQDEKAHNVKEILSLKPGVDMEDDIDIDGTSCESSEDTDSSKQSQSEGEEQD